MIRHSGACVLLSTLILILAAVVLYRSEPPTVLGSSSPTQVEAPPQTPSSPVSEVVEPAPIETPTREKAESSPSRPENPSQSTAIRTPEAPFTLSEKGETLEDVARRIYGTSEVAESLRLFNRDLIQRVDSPIKTGSALRTPPLSRQEASERRSGLMEEAP